MSEVQWNALMNAPNAGVAFSNAFQQGMQQRQQAAMQQQQMQEHQEDRQFKREQMQSEATMRGVEQHREAIKTGAAIIRQVQPRDDASWQQALGLLQNYGINPQELGVPMQFDPSYVEGVTKLADALDPQSQGNAPTSYEEYQRAQQDPNYMKFLEAKQGPIVTHNDDGTLTLVPRNMLPGAPPQEGGNIPSVTDEASYNAIPPGTQYRTPDGHVRVKQGGPAGNQPGGFR
jgi:hypothetical protein